MGQFDAVHLTLHILKVHCSVIYIYIYIYVSEIVTFPEILKTKRMYEDDPYMLKVPYITSVN